MTIATLLRNDARLQVRHGFWTAYAVVTAAYIVLLRQVPDGAVPAIATLVVFSDPAVFGFFCVGALLLLERDEGVHAALFTTPARPASFVLSKAVTLALLAVVTSLAIAAGSGAPFGAAPLAAGVALTAILFVHAGIVVGCHATTFNRFALLGGLGMLVLSVPLLPFFGWLDAPALTLLPSYASLVLIGGAFGVLPDLPQSAPFAVTSLAVWSAAAWLAARTAVARRLAAGS